MTSSDFIYKFGFRARIKKLETAIRKHSSSKKHPVDKTKSIHYFYGCVPTCKKASSCFQKKIFQKKIFQKKKIKKKGKMGSKSVRVLIKTASSATINTCLFYWTCMYGRSVKWLFSACPVFSLFFCLAVNNSIGNVCWIFLNFCMWLEVFSTNQTAGLLKIQSSWKNLYQTCT